jgi:hypothetical protein
MTDNMLCRLCGYAEDEDEMTYDMPSYAMKHHINGHQLLLCEQVIYTDREKFAQHLEIGHGACWPGGLKDGLDIWQRVQFLEFINKQGLIRTSRGVNSRACCASVGPGYTFTFIDL